MKILVTGTNGLLGQKLINLISADPGFELIATGQGPCRLPLNEYTMDYHPVDLRLQREVDHLIDTIRPDVIIHAAAMTQVDQCEKNQKLCREVNVYGTKHLAKAAQQAGAFLLYVSTDFIFDGAKGLYVEEDNPGPVNYYGWSKLEGERLVQEHLDHWAIARTVLVYGVANDLSRSNLILWVRKNLMQGRPIKVVDDQWRTPTLVEDLAIGCLAIARNKKKGIFNLSGEEYTNPFEIALQTARFFGLDESLISPTNAAAFVEVGKRPPKTGFIIDKAKREIGFQPHTLQEGLQLVKDQLEQSELKN